MPQVLDRMRFIDSWLTGLGLEYIIPKLKANGITTPKKLAMLSLRDMYEVVGVEDAEDRKKLYFLIQRLQSVSGAFTHSWCLFFPLSLLFVRQILNNKSGDGPGGDKDGEEDDENVLDSDSNRNAGPPEGRGDGASPSGGGGGDVSAGSGKRDAAAASALARLRRNTLAEMGAVAAGVTDSLSTMRLSTVSATTDQSEEDLKVLRRKHQGAGGGRAADEEEAAAGALGAKARSPVPAAPRPAAVTKAAPTTAAAAAAARLGREEPSHPAAGRSRQSQSPTPRAGVGATRGRNDVQSQSPYRRGAAGPTVASAAAGRQGAAARADKSPVRSPLRSPVRSPVRSVSAGPQSPIRSPLAARKSPYKPVVGTNVGARDGPGVRLHVKPQAAAILRASGGDSSAMSPGRYGQAARPQLKKQAPQPQQRLPAPQAASAKRAMPGDDDEYVDYHDDDDDDEYSVPASPPPDTPPRQAHGAAARAAAAAAAPSAAPLSRPATAATASSRASIAGFPSNQWPDDALSSRPGTAPQQASASAAAARRLSVAAAVHPSYDDGDSAFAAEGPRIVRSDAPVEDMAIRVVVRKRPIRYAFTPLDTPPTVVIQARHPPSPSLVIRAHQVRMHPPG